MKLEEVQNLITENQSIIGKIYKANGFPNFKVRGFEIREIKKKEYSLYVVSIQDNDGNIYYYTLSKFLKTYAGK